VDFKEVKATFRNGVLEISVPIPGAAATAPHRVPVEGEPQATTVRLLRDGWYPIASSDPDTPAGAGSPSPRPYFFAVASVLFPEDPGVAAGDQRGHVRSVRGRVRPPGYARYRDCQSGWNLSL